MMSQFGTRSAYIAVAVIGFLIAESSAQASAPACAISDDPEFFVLNCTHGDITTESQPDARGAKWLTATTFTTDDGFFSNKLTIEGTARHIVPPHDEGPNPIAYKHSFSALVDGMAAGVYTDEDFYIVMTWGPDIKHGEHYDVFHSDVVMRVGDSDDILNYTLTVAGRHSYYPRGFVDVFSGKLLSLQPGGTTYGSASFIVEPGGQFTLGGVISGVDPGAIAAAHIHSALDGQILFDVGDHGAWTNLGGIAAAREIGNGQLSPLALQLLGSGDAVFDVHLDSGEIIQGMLRLVEAGLPGDYNLNRAVDAADYVVWRKSDGTQQGYDTWRANFGRTAGTGAGASANIAVPEPATLVLPLMGMLWVCSQRRTVS
jgi:hypothetical protein